MFSLWLESKGEQREVGKEKSMIESSVAITAVICTAMLWLLLGFMIGYECGKHER